MNDPHAQWNDTARHYSLHRCLHHFIEDQVLRTPDATALSYEGVSLTYDELNRRANRLARLLQSKGVKPDSIVGVCAHRSVEMVVSLLGILKAGGAYLPLDPEYPRKRLDYMVQESQCAVILAQKGLVEALPSGTAIIAVDDIAGVADFADSNPPFSGTSDNLAYVIYTSGSTGNPKGVMNTHKGIVNRLLWMQDAFALCATDTVVQKTPYSFDVSVWEFFWPLMTGARLVVARPEGHKDTDYLLDLIQREKITIIHFVPSMLRLFLEGRNLGRACSLRHVVCSGEALDIALQRTFFERMDSELHNLYGPTEAAVDVTYWQCRRDSNLPTVPIGHPIANIRMHILDERLEPVPIGESGELHIAGVGLARGYVHHPELTEQKFISDPFDATPGSRMYKTGDLARYLPDGAIEYLGRIDHQVKIRGFRIELGEIETHLAQDPAVKHVAVVAREDQPGEKRLVAYVVEGQRAAFSSNAARSRLAEHLPEYMVPAVFVVVDAFPLTASGKLDRLNLPRPSRTRPDSAQPYVGPRNQMEESIARIWCELLDLDSVGIDDNFFDLGGTSLLALRIISRINEMLCTDHQVVRIFQHPTIARYSDALTQSNPLHFTDPMRRSRRPGRSESKEEGIAVIGMSGRFPGARTIDDLWKNLVNGVESITTFTPEELGPGIDESLRSEPDYVRARGIVEDADKFDAAFFGITPHEAEVMDPQHRVFLELAWSALENAGHDPGTYPGLIGVYAGAGDNHYYSTNLLSHPDLLKMVGNLTVGYGNEKDYISTRASYLLNLTGPGVSVNTGCSTSLLAVDLAFRGLRDRECDMALAGGVDIHVPQKSGFLFQEGGTFSRDGHCRPFDADATGTMFCDGAGVVVLKRLSDALADGDTIYAVILSTAKNNDGSGKVSFLAPSVEGQARVVAMAQDLAGVRPEDFGYIEAHGTATPLGDPIEVEALTQAFRRQTEKKQFCGLGSIKGNIGHPTIAAGVAGLIKAVLCLYHEKIPATLHYKRPNPRIDFANSPFKVVDALTPWPRGERSRIAGVSSFGFGGTNVHAIVNESPPPVSSVPSRPAHLLLLSAKTAVGLDAMATNLRTHVSDHPDCVVADAAFTLQRGRAYLPHRRFLVVKDRADAVGELAKPSPHRSATRVCTSRDPRIVFLFPGQGSQYVNMGKSIYEVEPFFRETVDRCCRLLVPHLGRNLLEVIHPDADNERTSYEALKDTFFTQPALFTIEYSLAMLWMSWGIKPAMMVGHSIGEFACACLAGVFTLEDALRLVATRGRLMKGLPRGSMLSVRASAEQVEKRLPSTIQLAAANGPSLCVVSGPDPEVLAFQGKMEAEGLVCRPLHTSHAFHSAMMDSIVEPFTQEVSKATLHPPLLPFVSSVTGMPITEAQATSSEYWGSHLRMPVRFSMAISSLVDKNNTVFLEVGPRVTLSTLARQHARQNKDQAFVFSLSDSADDGAEWTALLAAVGHLWLNGYTIDWDAFYARDRRRRIPLPTYPFERKRFWVDPVFVTGIPATPSPVASAQDPRSAADAIPLSVKTRGDDLDSIKERLTTIICGTAGIALAEVSTSSTFLEMGMDSLSLTQIAFQLQRDFSVKLTFGQLLKDYPSIDVLTDYVKKCANVVVPSAVSRPGPRAGSGGPLRVPATVAQRGIWSSSQLGAGPSCAYNESISIRLTGNLNLSAVEKAIGLLSVKHEAFRAHFADHGSTMIIEASLDPVVQVHDAGPGDPGEMENVCQYHILQETSTAFDLDSGPLLRARIVTSSSQVHLVILTAHHIVCDGWSLDALIYDFLDFYKSLSAGILPSTSTPYSFSEYAEACEERERGDVFAQHKAYWHDMYRRGIPELPLPLDAARPSPRSYEARRVDRVLDKEVVDKLRRASADLGCSFFSAVLSALAVFLHKLSSARDVVIGLPTAEQARIGQKQLVGHCVNIIPLRMTIDADRPFSAVIIHTQRDLVEAYGHQDYSLIHLLSELPGRSKGTGAPPVSVGLTNVKRWEPQELPDTGCKVEYFANPKSFESFELYFNIIESSTSTALTCHYNRAIFAAETVNEWLDKFAELLRCAADSPGNLVSDLLSAIPVHPQSPKRLAGLRVAPRPMQVDRTDDREQPSEFETKISTLWSRVLGLQSIDRHISFFDLGGHSLLAAKLFAELEKTTGIAAPLSLLYEAPTVAQMTSVLGRNNVSQRWKSIVPIKSTGSHHPLFLIHGAEGNVLLYRDLAKYLDSDRPLYGLQSSGLDGKSEIDANFERVAVRYVNEIRSLQPHGPYHIGGYCLGGTIALEVGLQLLAAGERVAFLCMIENYNIKAMRWPMPWYLSQYNRALNVAYHVGNLASEHNSDRVGFLRTKAAVEISRIGVSASVMWSRMLSSLGAKRTLGYHHVRISALYDDALIEYTPQQYPGPIHLFVAHRRLAGFTDPLWGWGNVAQGGAKIHEIPVNPRGTLVEPFVKILAQKLNAALGSAQ